MIVNKKNLLTTFYRYEIDKYALCPSNLLKEGKMKCFWVLKDIYDCINIVANRYYRLKPSSLVEWLDFVEDSCRVCATRERLRNLESVVR